MDPRKVEKIYHRTHIADNPQHAERLAAALRSAKDVDIIVEGEKVRIRTTVYEGEHYSKEDADDAVEERVVDTRRHD